MPSDLFAYLDGNLGTVSGNVWVNLTSNEFTVASGAVEHTNNDEAFAYYDEVVDDVQVSEVDVTLGSDFCMAGPMVRGSTSLGSGSQSISYRGVWTTGSGGTYGILYNDGTGGGQEDLVLATGVGTSGTRRLRLEAEGTALRLYVDGVLEVSTTHSALTSGRVGLYAFQFGTTPVLDNWAGGALVAPPPLVGVEVSSTPTVDVPAGTDEGHVMLLFYFHESSGGDVANFAPPAAFTNTIHEWATGFDTEGGLYWKVATASEPADYTMSEFDTGGECILATFDGVDPSAPISDWSFHELSTNPYVLPSLDPVLENCLGVVLIGGFAFDITAWTYPAGWTNEAEQDGSASVSMGTKDVPLTTFPTGTVSVTNNGPSDKGGGFFLALSPAPSGALDLLKVGGTQVLDAKVGSTDVLKMYVGAVQIYP